MLFSTSFIVAQSRVSNDQITTKGGLKYFESNLYTGVVYINHKNRKVWKEGSYVDGKLQGLSKGYYESGQLWFEQDISNGNYIYIKKWHKNGQLMSEQHNKKGRISSYKEWDETGQLVKEE